jgi:hypothetical protein
MSEISVESYTFTSSKGLFFKSGTHEEALEFLENMKLDAEHTTGWIKTDWGSTHVRAHEDGLGAVATSGVFDKGDQLYFYNLIGKEATDLMLRHHSVRDR